MIPEILSWIQTQNAWAEPIVNVLIAFACIKYKMKTFTLGDPNTCKINPSPSS